MIEQKIVDINEDRFCCEFCEYWYDMEEVSPSYNGDILICNNC